MWGNPLQNFGCLLQLVKLIKYKKISVGEPLKKLRLLSSVASPSLDFLMRPRADNLIRFVRQHKILGKRFESLEFY